MNCDQVQEWLELNIGSELTQEISTHIDHCHECTAFKTELDEISALLESPHDRFPSDLDASELAETTILRLEHKTKVTPLVSWRNWSTRVATAATVVLVAAGSYWLSNNRGATEPPIASDMNYNDIQVVLPESELQPDDATVESLYSGLVNVESSMAADVLLDDLSEDEYDYLQKNFDAGELLL